jgi:hypothetical protein
VGPPADQACHAEAVAAQVSAQASTRCGSVPDPEKP